MPFREKNPRRGSLLRLSDDSRRKVHACRRGCPMCDGTRGGFDLCSVHKGGSPCIRRRRRRRQRDGARREKGASHRRRLCAPERHRSGAAMGTVGANVVRVVGQSDSRRIVGRVGCESARREIFSPLPLPARTRLATAERGVWTSGPELVRPSSGRLEGIRAADFARDIDP